MSEKQTVIFEKKVKRKSLWMQNLNKVLQLNKKKEKENNVQIFLTDFYFHVISKNKNICFIICCF